MKADANPMHSAHEAPRCTARAKSTANRCKAFLPEVIAEAQVAKPLLRR